MSKRLILAVVLSLVIVGGSFSIASADCCFNPCSWFSWLSSCGCCQQAAAPAAPTQYTPQYTPPADRDISPPPRQDLN